MATVIYTQRHRMHNHTTKTMVKLELLKQMITNNDNNKIYINLFHNRAQNRESKRTHVTPRNHWKHKRKNNGRRPDQNTRSGESPRRHRSIKEKKNNTKRRRYDYDQCSGQRWDKQRVFKGKTKGVRATGDCEVTDRLPRDVSLAYLGLGRR